VRKIAKKTSAKKRSIRREAKVGLRGERLRGVATSATWFFADSFMHWTTRAQGEAGKWTTCEAPTGGAGAFGQPGVRPPSGGQVKTFAAKTQYVASVYWIPQAVSSGDATHGGMIILRNTSSGDQGGGGEQFVVIVRDDGTLQAWTGTEPFVGRHLLGQSAAGTVAFNVQHHLRVAVKIHSSTGTVDFDLDGFNILHLTGVNTNMNGSGSVTSASFLGDGESNQGLCYYSHMLMGATVTDGVGLLPRVTAVYATANGTDADMLDQAGGVPADPKVLINEHPPDDTTYLRGSTAGQRNSFFFANSLPSIARVLCIQTVARVGKTDSTARTGRSYFTLGGTRYTHPDVLPVPALPAYLPQMFVADPSNPGNEFTPAEVNAPIEAGWVVES
jgi:hypothetical protein